jgi:hypothetical protein
MKYLGFLLRVRPKSASNRVSNPAVLSHDTRCEWVSARVTQVCTVSSFGFSTLDSLRHTDLGHTPRCVLWRHDQNEFSQNFTTHYCLIITFFLSRVFLVRTWMLSRFAVANDAQVFSTNFVQKPVVCVFWGESLALVERRCLSHESLPFFHQTDFTLCLCLSLLGWTNLDSPKVASWLELTILRYRAGLIKVVGQNQVTVWRNQFFEETYQFFENQLASKKLIIFRLKQPETFWVSVDSNVKDAVI